MAIHENGVIKRSYRRWSGMLRRCYDEKSHIWKYYGGRGIGVCERWRVRPWGYKNFVEDMGEPPVGMTLDRVNNDGNYEPGNCRWATQAEQAKNRRPRAQVEGSLRQRARAAGLPYLLVYLRVKRLGWTEERALTTPKLSRGRQVGWRGKYKASSVSRVNGPPVSKKPVVVESLEKQTAQCARCKERVEEWELTKDGKPLCLDCASDLANAIA